LGEFAFHAGQALFEARTCAGADVRSDQSGAVCAARFGRRDAAEAHALVEKGGAAKIIRLAPNSPQ
jgi:hypothetical protein